MVARVPWSMLRPSSFEDHADDVALIYAAKWQADACGEAKWLETVIASHGEPPEGAIRVVLARALRMAAAQVEAGDGRSHLALGNELEA